ncbi:MAG: geranylgeranyl reductase family protein [Bacteroidetes bacterium]|nr:geranylgeranyl reductase family protein [Bacteroidota bacterium]
MSIKTEKHQLVIAGAGPAGATASAFLCKAKIPHLIFDKAVFPRDKICGDALSGKVMPVFRKLDPALIDHLAIDKEHFIGSYGIKFAAPNGKSIDIPFNKDLGSLKTPPGFISKRIDFDNFMVGQIDKSVADFRQGHELVAIRKQGEINILSIKYGEEIYEVETPLVIASEGDRSVISKTYSGFGMEPDHYCGGIRAYYSGVTGMHPMNFIELHFLDELLPGYFWIFPLPNGGANVGAGMLSSSISKKKINLREAMLKVIKENPTIKDRFANAVPEGKIQGWGLPLGSKKRPISGDGFILTGDAASMIDPFSGEGISNAMYCGMTAANVAMEAIKAGNFKSSFLIQYDEKIYNRLWSELQLSHTMQKLCKYPWLFNFVINKAEKNRTFRETISCMFDDLDLRARFKQPSFYFKLLFNH